jgi:hypothetical protein
MVVIIMIYYGRNDLHLTDPGEATHVGATFPQMLTNALNAIRIHGSYPLAVEYWAVLDALAYRRAYRAAKANKGQVHEMRPGYHPAAILHH